MKKILSFLLVLALLSSFCACGIGAKTDETFIKNLGKGLAARWEISNTPDPSTNSEYKDKLRNCVNAELNAIGELSEYTFEDTDLQELAKEYVTALQSQMEGISYYSADDAKYRELFTTNGYQVRAVVLSKIADNYSIPVGDGNMDQLDELIILGRSIIAEQKMLAAMQGIATEDTTLECLGGTDYQIVLENTTDYDLSGARAHFNFYDQDNILLDTVSTYMDSWKSGSKNKVTLWSNNGEPSSVKMTIEYYSNTTGNTLVTENTEIKYVNNMIITINVKNSLPQEFTYGYGKTVYTKCNVSEFSFDIGYWDKGLADITLKISGQKTYDKSGTNYSRACHVGWKLYDAKGVVLDSGTFYTSDLATNESFSECTSRTYDVPVGTYTLELLSVN